MAISATSGFFVLMLFGTLSLSNAFSMFSQNGLRSLQLNSQSREVMKLSTSANESMKLAKNFVMPLIVSSVLVMTVPLPSNAYWNESGEWIELKESSVTEVWGDRLKKASTMSPSDIFMAAKGAGNNDKR